MYVCVSMCVHVCVCEYRRAMRLSYPSDARRWHFVLLEDAAVVELDVVRAVVPVARYDARVPYAFLLEVALHPVTFLVHNGKCIASNACRSTKYVIKSI